MFEKLAEDIYRATMQKLAIAMNPYSMGLINPGAFKASSNTIGSFLSKLPKVNPAASARKLNPGELSKMSDVVKQLMKSNDCRVVKGVFRRPPR